MEVNASSKPQDVVKRVQGSKAVGVLALLEGLGDNPVRDLDEAFDEVDFFFRLVAAENYSKRTEAIDLVVDMMLLKSG